jgi:hypothetical protein
MTGSPRKGSVASVDLPMRCRHCGDIIGAYEPVVVRSDAGVWRTYRAMAHAIAGGSDGAFHASCYAAIESTGPAREDT